MIHAEEVLLGHLSDADSLNVLSKEGFLQAASLATIPTELVRKITGWAIAYYWENGRKVGPSQEAIREVWGAQLDALEIKLWDPHEEIDSIEWAITHLRAQYAVSQSQRLVRKSAAAVSRADPTAKVAAVLEASREWHLLAQSLSSRREESTADLGFEDALLRHEDRRVNGHNTLGMTLGLDLIDKHTFGVHPGELAIFAMTSGGGKSWVAGHTMLEAWKAGRRSVLVTLENDLEMTFDRLCCMYARVDYTRWQRGEANDGEVFRVLEATDQLKQSDHKPVVTMLKPGERDPLSIVRRVHTLGGEELILDQISYVEKVIGSKARERHQIVAEEMRELRECIRDDAAGKLPGLVMAQINREGRVAARKTGRYDFEHLGLSTEIENIADFVWAGFQTEDHVALQRAEWQELKFRRGARQDFDMRWRLDVGDIRALNPIDRSAA